MCKRVITLLLTVSLLLCGCQLAQEAEGAYHLIGVLITEEPFGYENEVLFAHLSEEEDCYVFEEGFALLLPEPSEGSEDFSMTVQEPISLGSDRDTEDSFSSDITVSGTLYVTLGGEATETFIHPVYQNEEGQVFAQCSIQRTTTEGCDREGDIFFWNSTEDSFRAVIRITGVYAVSDYRFVYMDADWNILNEEVFPADQVPESVSAPDGSQYIIVESHRISPDGTTLTDAELYTQGQSAQASILVPCGERYQTSAKVTLNWP